MTRLTTLENSLNSMFGGRRRPAAPKTYLVAILPDGIERRITKEGKLWTVNLGGGVSKSSSSLVGMEDIIADYNGKIVRRSREA